MAIVPNDTRFIGIAPSVDLKERKSAKINKLTEPYTMQDIADSAEGGAQTVLSGLIAQGTTDTTTSVMEYAVNVFTTATSTDFATKLPQPTTGKSTKVINMSSRNISVYPSNIGGKINNLSIDQPLIIPNDGKVYEFICTLNPLPGNWNTLTAPATGQKIFAEIVIPHTNGVNSGGYGYTTANMSPAAGLSYDSNGNVFVLTGAMFSEPVKRSLLKMKIYTNLLDSDAGAGTSKYQRVSWSINTGYKTGDWSINSGSQIIQRNFYGGSFPAGNPSKSGSLSTIGTLNTPALVGDLGTYYDEVIPTGVGGLPAELGPGGTFSRSYYTFTLGVLAHYATKDYKFQIILEYI